MGRSVAMHSGKSKLARLFRKRIRYDLFVVEISLRFSPFMKNTIILFVPPLRLCEKKSPGPLARLRARKFPACTGFRASGRTRQPSKQLCRFNGPLTNPKCLILCGNHFFFSFVFQLSGLFFFFLCVSNYPTSFRGTFRRTSSTIISWHNYKHESCLSCRWLSVLQYPHDLKS